jgi:hypothetical protein
MKFTSNGIFHLPSPKATGKTLVLVSGSLGSATAKLGYMDEDNVFIPFESGTLSSGGQYKIEHGTGINLCLEITGASGTSLNVLTAGIQ